MDRTLNGEPIEYPCKVTNWDGCCDCGLIHLVFYEHEGKDMVMQKSYRDDHYTLQRRLKKPVQEWRYLFEVLGEVFDMKGYDFSYTLKKRRVGNEKLEVKRK